MNKKWHMWKPEWLIKRRIIRNLIRSGLSRADAIRITEKALDNPPNPWYNTSRIETPKGENWMTKTELQKQIRKLDMKVGEEFTKWDPKPTEKPILRQVLVNTIHELGELQNEYVGLLFRSIEK